MAVAAWACVPDAHSAVAADCRIVLVPGAFGVGTSSLFLRNEDYFAEYRAFFEAKGCAVKNAEFPPDGTIEERALVLKDQVARFAGAGAKTGKGGASVAKNRSPATPVVLVAHSQGALDARFALRTLGMPAVGTLISIGAPHSGTPVANWVVEQRERSGWLYWLLRLGGYDLKALAFAGEMTPEFLQRFLPRFEKVAKVRYASAQGVCRTSCHWALRALSRWVGKVGSATQGVGPGFGDGMVGRDSQTWGDDLGEYDLDHLSEVAVDAAKRSERARFLARTWDYLNPAASH